MDLSNSQPERERENSKSKTLILEDSSVRSIWTSLTASPCYTTNPNKHDNTTNIICTIMQLINAVAQFLQMCRNITERERERERERGERSDTLLII